MLKKVMPKKVDSRHHYAIERGLVYCLEPLSENKNIKGNMVVIVSNKLHNQFADYLIVALVTNRNVEQVRPSFEVIGQIEKRKIKILTSHLHTIKKEIFYQLEHYLGKLDKDVMEKVDSRIRSVLDL
jgi:mRNA-degrading endonuclease toxin of MazEF toxin-antitoxin module